MRNLLVKFMVKGCSLASAGRFQVRHTRLETVKSHMRSESTWREVLLPQPQDGSRRDKRRPDLPTAFEACGRHGEATGKAPTQKKTQGTLPIGFDGVDLPSSKRSQSSSLPNQNLKQFAAGPLSNMLEKSPPSSCGAQSSP